MYVIIKNKREGYSEKNQQYQGIQTKKRINTRVHVP